ncbi:MAG: hypothetical protein IPJ07_14600 [Acidobacteria bacterium]|nr:hypothetical protein [Acidobacteriota bacterium]
MNYLCLNEVPNGAAGYYARRGGEHLRSFQNNRLKKSGHQASRTVSPRMPATQVNQGSPGAAKTAANQALRFAPDGVIARRDAPGFRNP